MALVPLPKPRICTLITDGWLRRASSWLLRITSCAAWLALLAAALAEASALTFTDASTGRPLLSPCTWMLAALSTCSAARLMLPETRIPASPASMVPSGAIRSTSPGGTSAMGFNVAMPAPLAGACGDRITLPQPS